MTTTRSTAKASFDFAPSAKRRREDAEGRNNHEVVVEMGHTGEFFKRRDEWRRHPMLTSNLRQATPGLGIALVAFGIYCVGEQVYYKLIAPSPSHHHQKQHSPASSSH